jgi:hypothetical protein
MLAHYPFQEEHFFLDTGNFSHQGGKVKQNHRSEGQVHGQGRCFFCMEIHMFAISLSIPERALLHGCRKPQSSR